MKKISFKQFLNEESSYTHMVNSYEGKNLSVEDIHKLEEPSPSNFESRYRVGNVYFDNEHGMGAVPDNRNVEYKGFVSYLTPKEFLKLAANHNGQREESAQDFKKVISEGYPIGAPFIDITLSDIGEGGYATVMGHEGRARMLALLSFANEGQMGLHASSRFPVHFFLRDGLRARHISDEMLKSLSEDGIIPEDERRKPPKSAEKVKFVKEIYVNGKKIEL
jgi:antitoxin component YwqK of YwqJK toxin-antitoxin module